MFIPQRTRVSGHGRIQVACSMPAAAIARAFSSKRATTSSEGVAPTALVRTRSWSLFWACCNDRGDTVAVTVTIARFRRLGCLHGGALGSLLL